MPSSLRALLLPSSERKADARETQRGEGDEGSGFGDGSRSLRNADYYFSAIVIVPAINDAQQKLVCTRGDHDRLWAISNREWITDDDAVVCEDSNQFL